MRHTTQWCVIAVVAWTLAAPQLSAQQPRPGQGLSVEVVLTPQGRLVADKVETLPKGRSLSLRGPLEAVDAAGGVIRLLGRWVRVIPGTTDFIPEMEASIGDLRLGEPVEIKASWTDDGALVAHRLQTGAKASLKVKGTLQGIEPHEEDGTLWLSGIPILLNQGTDWIETDNGLFTELFGVLKADESLGDDGGYHQLGSRVLLSGSLRPIVRVRDNSLDGVAPDRRGVSEPSARLEMLVTLPGVNLFAQGRVRSPYEFYRSGDEPESGAGSAEWELRQLYLSARSPFGLPVGFTVGKQRVRDNREFLFDDYLDGVRFYAYPLAPLVLEASFFWPVVPRRDKFETWRDVLLQARLFPAEDWRATVYSLTRHDDDLSRGRNVRYYGASMEGKHGFFKLWGNGALLRGEDKGRVQEAWAWDGGVGLRARGLPLRPGVSFSVARGSGDADKGDGVSREFRQPGYEDNSSRVWGIGSFRHFGEALDPELSNIEVVTASVGFRTRERLSVDFVGHRYRLLAQADELEDVALHIPSELIEGVHFLGSGADLIVAMRDFLPGVHFTYKAGVFIPGSAFELGTPRAWVHKVEFRVDF